MIDQDLLRDLTESYLKSLISEVSGSMSSDFDSFAPFGELGIDSFHVLKIIRRLELDFGTLPKSLLFENFNINDLANYFARKYEQILCARFSKEMPVKEKPKASSNGHTNGHANGSKPKSPEVAKDAKPQAASRTNGIAREAAPICILHKELSAHPELQQVVHELFDRYKMEGGVSRGTSKIAPNLFIGSAKRGYFNYGRCKNIILVYAFTGPRDYFPTIMEEMYRYCEGNNFQLNIFADESLPPVAGISFSATPFGVLQRISNLKKFTLDGGEMRRLRYQVSKFQKSGLCKTEEYRCGSNPETDNNIAVIIDRWCATRTMVNPLVHDVKAEILAGTLQSEHRLFLTSLDGILQNVILITAMAREEKGYLMDLEFYPPEMPMGGLEFAIVQIIETLAAEGCDVLSLGGTYGCKLNASGSADPEIDKILDDLRRQNIFNDAGNLQFKNKFRPENKEIFLCRPVGSANPDNVIDIIMMIADPDNMQTPDGGSNHALQAPGGVVKPANAASVPQPSVPSTSAEPPSVSSEQILIEEDERLRILSNAGFNPLNMPHEHVELDLKTDSWAQLHMPSIEAQMKHLHAELQQPANVDESLRAVFPFAHFVLTASGQEAEHVFFKAWPKKGGVLQNLLFPSTIFHQIDKGFTNKELPCPAVFDLNSREPDKGNMDWEALQVEVAKNPAAISMVCIEVGNNAAGGHPVSMQHLRDVKKLLAQYSIPLVIDGTRVMENAQLMIEQEYECAEKSIWAVVREIFSHADAVIGSLSKDFCVNKGGIIATNDTKLFHRLQELVHEEAAGIDLIDKKMIALSFRSRKQIEAKVLRRMEGVRLIWRALNDCNVPVVQPAGGHCILIDVKQIPEFKAFKYPVASFLAWLYLNTGIRAAAHSVGMQKQTSINDLVRLAIPIGLSRDQIDTVIDRLIGAFAKKTNIPEIDMEKSVPQPLGTAFAKYKLIKYHNVPQGVAARTESVVAEPQAETSNTTTSSTAATPASAKAEQDSSSHENGTGAGMSHEDESAQIVAKKKIYRKQDIAIVGMAGRYPKAKNPRELWENLAQGRDCIEEISADRYEWRLLHGSSQKYRGGFIDDVDKFDSLFFNISPREAEMLDPQERLFLEVAWEALEDAGYYPETLAKEDEPRNIGVFVGAVWTMYQMLGVEEKHLGNKIVPNSFLWSIANRASYWLNLSGPSLTLDTACSSSLTAIHLACEAIYAGDCSAAIVGGVNLDLHQTKTDINQTGGALSPDGVCRSFGKGANGYVQGEGVGALFLKPLGRAVQDGDNIYGVIKSAVVNHGGRTSGYTVPNPKAQANLILSAFEKAGIGARSIGYIEAHGTGTELGDPVEITGLSNAFSADNVANQTCAIGSIKSNIGHLEAAAGIASVSKVLLQMKHHQLVPSLHSAELNEFIDFKNSPFYVVQRVEDWKPREVDGVQLPLRAGISSFGAGGSNAHIILESYESVEKDQRQPAQPSGLIFPLSARNEDQLRDAAVRLVKFLEQSEIDLNDAAHTLQTGRKSFEHRLAVIARTKEELLEKLTLFINGKKAEEIVTGNVKSAEGLTRLLNRKEKEEFIRFLLQRRDPRKVAELWVEGLVSDWRSLQTNGPGKRISLPTYPFADKRHWAFKKSTVRHSLQPAAGIHPMVDANESTFDRQLFKKTFHERDFFIYDHLVANIPTLPGVAYLELARKAGELAAGRKVQKIRNILWVSPIAVQNSAPKEVLVELKPSEAAVKFEVFSHDEKGNKIPHSQGTLLYTTKQEAAAEPEYIDLAGIRARCTKVIDGRGIYPRFKSLGLNLGPSFQVLQEVYKNETEILGALKLPEFRQGELESLILHPSLVDGSLQAGVGAQLGEQTGDMFVPFSIGEVEVLHPLQPNCFSYVTEANAGKGKKDSLVLKSNVFIVDETGKVLVKIRESVGVPLRDIYKKTGDDDGFAKLYYSYDWEKAPLTVEKAEPGSPHAVVLFGTDEKLRDLYQERLNTAGTNAGQVILVQPGDSFQDCGNQSYKINPQNKDDFAKLFETLVAKQCPVEKICLAWQFGPVDLGDDKSVKASLERGVHSLLFVCQALIKQKLDSKVQLLYLYSAKPGEAQPHNEAVTGFVNTLRFEHPKLLCKAVDVRQEGVGYDQILDAAETEFQAHTQDATTVRYEAQDRYIRKLKAVALDETKSASASNGTGLKENGVYLITGGAGGLGLLFAEFLAKNYKAKIVLTGRSRLSAEREAKLEEIRKAGGEALYLPADVSNYEDVKNLVSECKSRFGAIHGIIHSAGVIRDSLIRNKTLDEMSAVFAPKVYGTLHLDEITKDEALDFFVTFSSLSAVAGNAGQCDYSFANSFMDSFAARREQLRANGARSGKTLSINWSLWADGGMRPDEQTELYFRKNLGMKPLSASAGLEAFVQGLASERTQFAMLEGVQEKIEMAWGLRKKPEPAPASSSSPATTSSVPDAKDGEILKRLQNDLSQIVMESLKLDASDVPPDKILLDLGFDSIGLTGYANIINEKYQLDITPVLFFDYPTIGDIAKYLCTERKDEILRFYGGSGAASKSAAPPAATQQQARTADGENRGGATFSKGWNSAALDREAMAPTAGEGFSPELRFVNVPIAIVGMSGVMPESDDMDEFWENLKNSKDMITVIPPDRWRWEDFHGDPLKEVNKTNSKWGGFMREVDKFDPLFFGISPREAHVMDPQQRIFLETVWKAIEDSGQKVSDLSGTRTGLFVGVATNDYADMMNRLRVALDGYTASGNSHAVLANRVSFLLNLRGPSAPIDTACSSSLVALHRAIESIHTGSCDMAIVGGVQAMLSPAAYISFSMAGMLSPDGKCKSFDKRANGYVRGEGCGAILLKTLAAAEADGNHIYAVIKATAENHGGKVTTLTAPNSSAQSALLVEAYEKAQIDPATVGFIECHGTGTSLGDPIEIQALGKAFSELYKKHNKAPAKVPHCGLSSVKTNIGHLETAAGIAGVLKVLLAIKHKQIPANLHFEELNPYISLKGTPFYIADKLTPWEAPKGEDGMPIPRRAGVSSFGFGGANAHIVLEEYIAPKRQSPAQGNDPQLIVLSAKNEDRLRAYVQSMHAYLDKKEVELADFAYTLQVGRDEMPERLALVVSSKEDLKQKLEGILKGERPEDSYRHNIRSKEAKSQTPDGAEGEGLVQALIEQRELSRLAELWVSGAKIDWRLLYKPGVPRRISVPTYPFARERHWFLIPAEKTAEEPKDSSPQKDSNRQDETKASLQSLLPVWNPAHFETSKQKAPPESTKILLLGSDQTHLEWLRKSYPNSQLLQLAATSAIEIIAKALADCSFDQLLWVAPDVTTGAGRQGERDEQIIEQQEQGVLSVFRIIKALLHIGYTSKKLQWTIVTSRTQRVTGNDRIQSAHAGIAGLVGSLAKEYPRWDLRLVDVDSLTSVTAQECLSLPWDKQGNALAHRKGEWFQQGLVLMASLPQPTTPIYRQNGVYVVIGGAGGLGEVWTRFMMEHYHAKVVWIGRRKYDAAIENKIRALAPIGHAPLYISADATNVDELEQAYKTILKTYPAIHGAVHSAIVLHDQTIARIDEAGFRAGLSAKVDISVNMDRVFGKQELDFMLFFSSIISIFKTPGQSNYAAGCTFKDSFAQKLLKQRAYPVKIMNWGYWGGFGVAADEFHRKNMARVGLGSIEPTEGMASLQALVSSEMSQMVLLKTLNSQATASLTLSESTTYPQQSSPANIKQQPSAELKRTDLKAGAVAAITAQQPQAQDVSPLDTETSAPYQYANKAEELYTGTTSRASSEFKEEYLTFAPFEKKMPGFSMSRVLLNPASYPEETNYVRSKQVEMRQVLFCKEDFGKLTSVFDFGCGHGTDVIQMGTLFPHLQIHGYTITKAQAILGNQRIANQRLDNSKITIYHKDSSRDAFPSQYDLVFGIEVSFHIRNKVGLFKNICSSLNEHGRVLLIDYVSNLKGSVDDPNVEISIPTQKEWVKLTAQFHLEIDEIIDVSPQVSNFLYDPDFKDNIKDLPEVFRKTFTNYANQSISLERRWLSYVLIKLKRNAQRSQEQIESHNLHKLQNPTPYPAALKAMLEQEHICYPPRDASSGNPSFENTKREAAVSQDQLQQELKMIIATALRIETSIIDVDAPFSEFGMDSVTGIETMVAINKKYGMELSNVTLFENPTVRAFAQFLEQEIKSAGRADGNPPNADTEMSSLGQLQKEQEIKSTNAPGNSLSTDTEAMGRLDQLQEELKAILATVLRIETSIIDVDAPFSEFGMDSVTGVETMVAINKKYGTELSNVTLFEHPTVREFAQFLEQEIKTVEISGEQVLANILWQKASLEDSHEKVTF